MDVKQTLKSCLVFAGLSDQELDKIAPLCHVEEYQADTALLREGERARRLYIVMEGEVAVGKFVDVASDEPLAIEADISHPGTLVGWSALVDPEILTASAKCVTDSRLLVVEAAALRRALQSDPRIGFEVVGRLNHLLSHMIRRMGRRRGVAAEVMKAADE
ncbi:MAG: cyclic nucleotide-binding domain-containing protein [Chloroflexi bacterium]|nr:cyclic nucleotide-binding domain-containing protein [Chloroflexota bacterium]